MKNIFLIGMMGSGKSTIGALLAEQLGYYFIDTDALIEKQEAKSVAEIFRDKGEAYFRMLEKALVSDLPRENAVIACGGGLPCFGDLIGSIQNSGMVVYLSADAATLFSRISKDTKRPLLQNFEDFKALLEKREPIYQGAEVVVNAACALEEVLVNVFLEAKRKIKV